MQFEKKNRFTNYIILGFKKQYFFLSGESRIRNILILFSFDLLTQGLTMYSWLALNLNFCLSFLNVRIM